MPVDANLNTVELVAPGVAGQALAHVAADHVDAARERVAVVAEAAARLLALVHIWKHISNKGVCNLKQQKTNVKRLVSCD